MSEEIQNEQVEENFELKIEEAKQLLDKLLEPDITLSNSVAVYKEGMEKIQAAQKMLDTAKLQFEEYSKEK